VSKPSTGRLRIIANADDFGLDADTVAATIAGFEGGSLTSASIMAKMPGTAAALDFARARPDLGFGVHLTYTCDTVEAPVLGPGHVPALVRPDGRFLPSNTVRLLALQGRLPCEQIIAETTAQLAVVRDSGVSLTHVDSHGHLHKFAVFREALKAVLPRFGIKRVRSVQDVYLTRPWKSPTYWLGAVWRARMRRDFATTDHFFMNAATGRSDWPHRVLSRNLHGTLEIGVHPGMSEPWRGEEARAVAEFAALARARGIEMISWARL
jgi:predicted glycoside hydrolase/deacetylase ChbG (UPF0249 family)